MNKLYALEKFGEDDFGLSTDVKWNVLEPGPCQVAMNDYMRQLIAIDATIDYRVVAYVPEDS